VRLSKDARLGAARKNAQLVARLRSQAEPPGHSCRAPAAIIKKLISENPPQIYYPFLMKLHRILQNLFFRVARRLQSAGVEGVQSCTLPF